VLVHAQALDPDEPRRVGSAPRGLDGGQPPEQVAVSDWVITEVSSALSIKQRTGDLDEAARRRAQSTFDVLVLDSTTVLDVPRECFARAAEMAGRAKLGLRSDDALHLAVAQHYGAQMCTRDERQAHAAGPWASTCSSWRRPNECQRRSNIDPLTPGES